MDNRIGCGGSLSISLSPLSFLEGRENLVVCHVRVPPTVGAHANLTSSAMFLGVCDLLENLRVLQPTYEHIVLIALAHAVACPGCLLYLSQ